MKSMVLSTVVMLVAVGAGMSAYFEYFEPHASPTVATSPVTAGEVIEVVKATGTLAPGRSVDVGTQISGTVLKLYVDFNSIVKKGQLLAQLDPALYRSQLDSARAATDVAGLALEEERRVLEEDQRNLERTQALLADGIAVQQDLDTAVVAVKSDQLQIAADEASLKVTEDNVQQAQDNLDYCTIYSPIDGVVISRDVDEGQTVSARMSAPSLYLLGADLQHLQLVADVDESNMSRLRPGQPVTFTVDAYGTKSFSGTVTEVRLNATTINAVVTYQALISAPNPDLRLLPGMTASVMIETSRTGATLRVDNRALRFQPTPAMFGALGQPVPPALNSTMAGAAAPGGSVRAEAKGTPASASDAGAKAAVASAAGTPGATIDKYFEPLAAPKRPARVWVVEAGRLEAVPIEAGLTDGTRTQVVSGALKLGTATVTSIVVPTAPTHTTLH